MTTDLATVQAEMGIVAATPFRFNDGQFWTSLDFNNNDELVHLFRMRQSSDKTFKDCANMALEMVHILRHWAEGTDDATGEVRKYIRTVFLTKEGDVVSAGSIGIERDIETLFALGVFPPWNPPLKTTPTLVKGKGPNSMLNLKLDMKDLAARMKAAKKGKK